MAPIVMKSPKKPSFPLVGNHVAEQYHYVDEMRFWTGQNDSLFAICDFLRNYQIVYAQKYASSLNTPENPRFLLGGLRRFPSDISYSIPGPASFQLCLFKKSFFSAVSGEIRIVIQEKEDRCLYGDTSRDWKAEQN